MKRQKHGGRAAGTPNKATGAAREAIAAFVDHNTARLDALLDAVEREEGAKAAFECICDLIEYHVPKRARVNEDGKTLTGITVVLAKEDADA